MIQVFRRWPTAEEIKASVKPPLCESYWWLTGMNYNRPVIISLWNGATRSGPVPRVRFPGMTEDGIRTNQTHTGGFVLVGPIAYDGVPEEEIHAAAVPTSTTLPEFPCVVQGRIRVVTQHASDRFKEHSGCKKKHEATVLSIQRLIAVAHEMRLKPKYRVVELLNHGTEGG